MRKVFTISGLVVADPAVVEDMTLLKLDHSKFHVRLVTRQSEVWK